jgi:predicted GH43/DUF377 family glycosyl hydrolase
MRIPLVRKQLKIYPDLKRVIARFFYNGEDRARNVIQSVMQMSDEDVEEALTSILREFARRHRNITRVFEKNCDAVTNILTLLNLKKEELSLSRKMLIGSYFTHEYSIESAAFFNPSIVEDPDQSDLHEGEKRVVLSFRAVGEGHISSITFRRAVLDMDNNIVLTNPGILINEADIIRNAIYKKDVFARAESLDDISTDLIKALQDKLPENFDYSTLKKTVNALKQDAGEEWKIGLERVLWLADSYHYIHFSMDTDLSDRVIFPISEFEIKGVEDARFVQFKNNGDSIYYATYTAYDGLNIQPKLLETKNFYDFKVMPLYGKGAQNKNLALFPRKINGKYAMLSRIDGVNNYIMFSDKINVWENPQLLQEPKHPWEFIQIGNCGSPIETRKGWLLITHGVGSMRRYCLGASLFDLEDPTKEIGRLKEPLLMANDDEREGYVPNVLYTCGCIIHNNELVIPYGLSDYATGFATVPLDPLLEKILSTGNGLS